MVLAVSQKITNFFINIEIIDISNKEICEYVIQTKIMFAFTILSIYILLIAKVPFLQITAYLFVLLSFRSRTGGYHASSELKCYIQSIVLSIFSLIILLPILMQANILVAITLYIISTIIILAFAPVNHPNIDMDRQQLVATRTIIIRNIALLSVLFYIISLVIKSKTYTCIISISIFIVCLSILLAKLIKQEVKTNEH